MHWYHSRIWSNHSYPHCDCSWSVHFWNIHRQKRSIEETKGKTTAIEKNTGRAIQKTQEKRKMLQQFCSDYGELMAEFIVVVMVLKQSATRMRNKSSASLHVNSRHKTLLSNVSPMSCNVGHAHTMLACGRQLRLSRNFTSSHLLLQHWL